MNHGRFLRRGPAMETAPTQVLGERYHKALVDPAPTIAGDPLQVQKWNHSAIKEGKRRVQDGLRDTKEQLGGFIILEAPSLDEALDLGSALPAASAGVVEVVPLHLIQAPDHGMMEAVRRAPPNDRAGGPRVHIVSLVGDKHLLSFL